MADSAEMVPFSLAVCQSPSIGQSSGGLQSTCSLHGLASLSGVHTPPVASSALADGLFPSLTIDGWVSARHLPIWRQILKSPSSRTQVRNGFNCCTCTLLCQCLIQNLHFQFPHGNTGSAFLRSSSSRPMCVCLCVCCM